MPIFADKSVLVMELRQLKYFVEVGRLGSFSLASKSLFITQSTISQQIQKLEEELGVELLTRDTRHVTLSDYGEQFFPCAVQVLEEARAGAERIQDVKALQVGTLSVGATYSFGPLLKQTVLDFYHIESHLLFQSRLSLVGRIGELKGVGREVSVQDLSRFPLALPAKGLQARDSLEAVLFAQNVKLDIRLEINSVRSLLDLVGSSPLVTILSEEAIHQVQGFEAVPIAHPDGRMDGCYHFLKGSYHKIAARKFVEMLKENNSFNQTFA